MKEASDLCDGGCGRALRADLIQLLHDRLVLLLPFLLWEWRRIDLQELIRMLRLNAEDTLSTSTASTEGLPVLKDQSHRRLITTHSQSLTCSHIHYFGTTLNFEHENNHDNKKYLLFTSLYFVITHTTSLWFHCLSFFMV